MGQNKASRTSIPFKWTQETASTETPYVGWTITAAFWRQLPAFIRNSALPKPEMDFLKTPIQTNSLPAGILKYWVWTESKKVLSALNSTKDITEITIDLSFRNNQSLPIEVLHHWAGTTQFNTLQFCRTVLPFALLLDRCNEGLRGWEQNRCIL